MIKKVNRKFRKVGNLDKQAERIAKEWHEPFLNSIMFLEEVNGIKLNVLDRLVYSYLVNWSDLYINKLKRPYYAPAYATMKDYLGISLSQVKRIMPKLVKCGVVIVNSRKHNFPNDISVVNPDDSITGAAKGFEERNEIKVVAIKEPNPEPDNWWDDDAKKEEYDNEKMPW